MNKSCLVLLFAFVVLTFAKDNAVGHPVAFVPGIIGTVLHAFVPTYPLTIQSLLFKQCCKRYS